MNDLILLLLQIAKLNELRLDKALLDEYVEKFNFKTPYPFNYLYSWAEETLGEEAQELLVSLILEPFGELVDDLSGGMSDKKQFSSKIKGSMLIGEFLRKTEQHYAYALKINWENSKNNELAWYISEEKLEPRLGNRFTENGIAFYEQPLQPGRDVARMHFDLSKWKHNKSIAEFLMKHPEHRHIIRRCQIVFNNPYAEIKDKNNYFSPNIPKVIFHPITKNLIYMSRAAIPANKKFSFEKAWKQVCIYAFPKASLLAFSTNSKTPLEAIEDIEVLRFLELGYRVQMIPLSGNGISIDVPEDIKKVESYLNEN